MMLSSDMVALRKNLAAFSNGFASHDVEAMRAAVLDMASERLIYKEASRVFELRDDAPARVITLVERVQALGELWIAFHEAKTPAELETILRRFDSPLFHCDIDLDVELALRSKILLALGKTDAAFEVAARIVNPEIREIADMGYLHLRSGIGSALPRRRCQRIIRSFGKRTGRVSQSPKGRVGLAPVSASPCSYVD